MDREMGSCEWARLTASAVAPPPLPPRDAYEQALAAAYTGLDDVLSRPVISGRWEDSNPPGTLA